MPKKFDVVIFDVDSTLVSVEGLLWLSQREKHQELPLLSASKDGKIPLKIAFQNEMALISPSYKDMLALGRLYRESLVDHAREVIHSLQVVGKDVWLISNDFHPSIDIIASALNIPSTNVFGNTIFYDEYGKYQGFDPESPLVRNGGKAEIIKRHISPDQRVAFVGDAVPDVETKPVVDLFVGFGGVISRPQVRQEADVYLNDRTLKPLLPLLLDQHELELLNKHASSAVN